MKLSQFVIFIPDFPSDGKCLVYNTFNQATAVIGERAKDFLSNLQNPPLVKGGPRGDFRDDEKKYTDTFMRLGFVVDDPVDEIEEFKKWYNQSRYDKSTMRATILTTYDCNFACEYCVQGGVKSKVRMDEEGCRSTVDWLIERVDRYQSDEIRLQFYGGEPLMNVLPIYMMASEINKYSKRNGSSFSFTITTNGSLLKPDLVEKLTPLGLKSIKITLDGDREAHNSKRPFRSGKGSFDIIIENILQVIDKVKVRIGTNVDDSNLESVPRLLDYLEQIGLKDKIDSIKFDPIVHLQGQAEPKRDGAKGRRDVGAVSRPRLSSAGALSHAAPPEIAARRPLPQPCPSFEDRTLDNLIWLTWDAYKRGFKTENTIQSTICSMNLDGTAVVIDPIGRIYTCPAFVGREGFQTGDIYHQDMFDKHREFMSMEVPDDCFKCVYVPMCGGGCKHLAYTRYGDLGRTVCEKDYLQRATAESLKMYVLSQRA